MSQCRRPDLIVTCVVGGRSNWSQKYDSLKMVLPNESTWVNFIKMFTCSFYTHRSGKRKKLHDLAVFFALLGFARGKAAHKMMVKLTPGFDESCATTYTFRLVLYFWPFRVNFPNILRNCFSQIFSFNQFIFHQEMY